MYRRLQFVCRVILQNSAGQPNWKKALQLKQFPTNGPFPALIDMNLLSDGGMQIDITYDQPILWNPTETEGFYICLEENVSVCNRMSGKTLWQKVSI